LQERPDGNPMDEQTWFQKIGGALFMAATVVLGFVLINSAYLAYAEGLRASSEHEKLNPEIEAWEMKVERETKRAINNLDPDYRRAVFERNRGMLSPGEELLPIYDDGDE
jgi:hypothetical protein